MKKNGRVSFSMISGERNSIKPKALTLQGQEVLRTEPYNLDGTPKGPDDLSLVSYFCLTARFVTKLYSKGRDRSKVKDLRNKK